MHTKGLFAPADAATAAEQYAAVEAAADTVVSELVRALPIAEAADERPDDATLRLTATEAIFASLLEVTVGNREEFDDWREDAGRAVEVLGSEHVSGVAWHDGPVLDRAIAATYEDEPAAAVAALRRQAFAKRYREVV